MKRFAIGTAAMLAVLGFAFWLEGGNLLGLLLPSPLIVVFIAPCCAVLAVWSFRDWGRAWKDAFAPSPRTVGRSASLWSFYEKASYVSAIVGTFLGLNIIFSSQYAEPNPVELGRALSVGCVAPILGIAFAMVARILRARVEEGARAE